MRLRSSPIAFAFCFGIAALIANVGQQNGLFAFDANDDAKAAVKLLQSKCVACHSSSQNDSGVVLEKPEQWLAAFEEKPLIAPGNHASSYVWQLASRTAEPVMPPEKNAVGITPLSPEEIDLLGRWIDAGATWPAASASPSISFRSLRSAEIHAVAVSGEGSRAVVAWGNRAAILRIPSGELESWLVDPEVTLPGTTESLNAADIDQIQAVAISANGNRVATGGFRNARIWESLGPKKLSTTALPPEATAHWISSANRLVTWNDAGRLWHIDGETAQVAEVVLPDAQKIVAGYLEQSSGALWIVTEKNLVIHWDTKENRPLDVWQLSERPAVGWPLGDQSLLLALPNDRLVRLRRNADVEPGTLEKPVTPVVVWEQTLQDPSGPVRQIVRLPKPADPNATADSAQNVEQQEVIILRNNQTVVGRAVNDGHEIPLAGWPGGIEWIAPSESGRVIFARASGQLAAWRIEAPDKALLKPSLSLIDQSTVDRTQWQVRWHERVVQGAEEDLRLAREEATAEQANVTTLEAEKVKAQEVVAAAQKEKEAKPDDAALVTKVQQAEGALQIAAEVLDRAKARLTAAQESASKFEADLAVKKGELEATRQKLTSEQQVLQQPESGLLPDSYASQGVSGLVVADKRGKVMLVDSELQQAASFGLDALAIEKVLPLGTDRVAIVFADRHLEIWSSRVEWRLLARLGKWADPSKFPDRVTALAFSPDGTQLATGSGEPSRTGQLKIWNANSGELLREIEPSHSDSILSLEFSPDGKSLASAAADRMIKIWDLESGKLYKTLEGHTHHVNSIAWRSDSRRLVSVSSDTTLKVWNTRSGQALRTVDLGEKEVGSIVFAGLTDQVFTTGGFGQVSRRVIDDGRQDAAYGGGFDYLQGLATDRDGKRVLTGGRDGVLRLWNADNSFSREIRIPN